MTCKEVYKIQKKKSRNFNEDRDSRRRSRKFDGF